MCVMHLAICLQSKRRVLWPYAQLQMLFGSRLCRRILCAGQAQSAGLSAPELAPCSSSLLQATCVRIPCARRNTRLTWRPSSASRQQPWRQRGGRWLSDTRWAQAPLAINRHYEDPSGMKQIGTMLPYDLQLACPEPSLLCVGKWLGVRSIRSTMYHARSTATCNLHACRGAPGRQALWACTNRTAMSSIPFKSEHLHGTIYGSVCGRCLHARSGTLYATLYQIRYTVLYYYTPVLMVEGPGHDATCHQAP